MLQTNVQANTNGNKTLYIENYVSTQSSKALLNVDSSKFRQCGITNVFKFRRGNGDQSPCYIVYEFWISLRHGTTNAHHTWILAVQYWECSNRLITRIQAKMEQTAREQDDISSLDEWLEKSIVGVDETSKHNTFAKKE